MSWMFLWIPLVVIVVALPMAMGWVPPNGVYGLRIPKTLNGPPELWYRANRAAGLYMLAAAVLSIVAAFLLDRTTSRPKDQLVFWDAVILLILIGVSTVASVLHARRM